MAAEKPKVVDQEQYKSQHSDKLAAGLDSIVNREKFSYDPLKDANYQSMAKLYEKQGRQAAQNAMGDAASLNGGYGSSLALTASQQARNDYNQMLASQLPALQEAAYNRYMGEHNLNLTALEALRAADESDYARYRDTIADNQWKYGADYQAYRDDIGDSQWQKSYDRSVYESDRDYSYQQSRDKVADEQWAKEYALSKSSAARSGSSSSGGGYLRGSGADTGIDVGDLTGESLLKRAVKQVSSQTKKKANKK